MDEHKYGEENLSFEESLQKLDEISDADTDPKVASEFVTERVKSLTEKSVRHDISAMTGTRHEGWIHPDSEVRRTFIVDPVNINDDQAYTVLIDVLKQMKAAGWKERGMRATLMPAIQHAIGTYFGNHYATEHTEMQNREFYIDHVSVDSANVSLSELRGKGFAVCAEKAALAQNMLAFAGMQTELILSNCQLIPGSEKELHTYNIISSDGSKHALYDPTNPIFLNDENGKLLSTQPSIHPLTDEQYQSLIRGESVTVKHQSYKKSGDKWELESEHDSIYAGPRNTGA
jgi:hypothetical protein